MLYTYEQYFAAKNGSDLTLTLDTTIQYYLERASRAWWISSPPPTAPVAS